MSLNKARKLRKIEKWTDLIKEFNIDISKPLNLVTADQIRTKREPRLMIKMDTLESLPQIFRDNSLFLSA